MNSEISFEKKQLAHRILTALCSQDTTFPEEMAWYKKDIQRDLHLSDEQMKEFFDLPTICNYLTPTPPQVAPIRRYKGRIVEECATYSVMNGSLTRPIPTHIEFVENKEQREMLAPIVEELASETVKTCPDGALHFEDTFNRPLFLPKVTEEKNVEPPKDQALEESAEAPDGQEELDVEPEQPIQRLKPLTAQTPQTTIERKALLRIFEKKGIDASKLTLDETTKPGYIIVQGANKEDSDVLSSIGSYSKSKKTYTVSHKYLHELLEKAKNKKSA